MLRNLEIQGHIATGVEYEAEASWENHLWGLEPYMYRRVLTSQEEKSRLG